jgi:hypothetical protein
VDKNGPTLDDGPPFELFFGFWRGPRLQSMEGAAASPSRAHTPTRTRVTYRPVLEVETCGEPLATAESRSAPCSLSARKRRRKHDKSSPATRLHCLSLDAPRTRSSECLDLSSPNERQTTARLSITPVQSPFFALTVRRRIARCGGTSLHGATRAAVGGRRNFTRRRGTLSHGATRAAVGGGRIGRALDAHAA